MKGEGYEALLEARLTDDQLDFVVGMLRLADGKLGELVDAVKELENLRDNFNYNADRILKELRKDG